MAQKTDVQLSTQKDEIKSETTANANTATRVGQMFEDIIDSKVNVADGITREFNRAFSSELLFDKNMIEGELHTQTDDITFTVSESGNLADQESIYGQRIVTDGVHPIYFPNFNHLANIASGDILEAGTYQFIFWYSNGIIRGSVMLPREETVMLTPLSTPANFAAVPGTDPETEVDLSWDAVPNVSSYEIYRSLTGLSGSWGSAIATPAAGDTTYTDTGRAPATTYHYRIRAIGDQVTFANSGYATATTTTENAGDMTAPTFVFSPADSETDIAVNQEVTITASAPLRDQDGATAITNANITDYVSAVDGDMNPVDISASTIDAAKTVFTIKTPSGALPPLEDITLTIDGVESSVNGVHAVSDSATFTTSDYTEMFGNHLSLGTQVDAYIAGNDIKYKIEFEFKDIVLSGDRGLTQKHNPTGMQVSHVWVTEDMDVSFKYYIREPGGGGVVGFSAREVIFPDALDAVTAGKARIEYDGTVDTNNGLDRVKLFLDDIEVTAGKSLIATDGSSVWPWAQTTSTAPFQLRGPTFRHVRNFKVYDGSDTVIVNIPIIRTGVDVSGNDFHGTWI